MSGGRSAAMRAVLFGAVIALLAPACDTGGPARQLGTERLVGDLTDAVVEDYGVEALDVDCPATVPAEEGGTFRCDVRLAHGVLTYEVTQVDDQGQLRFAPLGALVDPATPAARIAIHYIEQVGKNVDVFCGQDEVEFRVVEVGGSFVCRVVDRAGATDGVIVTVHDIAGEFTFEVRPGDAAGADY